jgi:hypothetical protein
MAQHVEISNSELVGGYIDCKNMHGMINIKLENEWKKCEQKRMWLNCSNYSKGQTKGMEKSTESDQESLSLGQDMNPGQAESEAVLLLPVLQCSIH